MKIWQIVVPGLLGLALAGCRSDPEVAFLERDNFKKEQEIDRLQNRVEDLEEALNTGAPVQPAPPRRAAGRNAARARHDGRRPIRPGQHPPRSALHAARSNQP